MYIYVNLDQLRILKAYASPCDDIPLVYTEKRELTSLRDNIGSMNIVVCNEEKNDNFISILIKHNEIDIVYIFALYELYPKVHFCINRCMNIPILDFVVGATRISRIETQTKASSFKNAFKKDAVRIIPKL